MNDINKLKDQQRAKHPGFDSYLECMSRAFFTGLAGCCLAFSGVYFLQKLLQEKIPQLRKTKILVSAVTGTVVAYKITSERTKACQAAWMAAEDKIFLPFCIRRSPILRPAVLPLTSQVSFTRSKYTQHTGVKGIRNRKSQFFSSNGDGGENEGNAEKEFTVEDAEYDLVASTAMSVNRDPKAEQVVFVIQPYVKYGEKRSATSPDLQLQEAEALIRSLPRWNIEMSLKVPLQSLEKRTLFGKGKLEEIKELLKEARSRGKRITCVFISKGTLSFSQKRFLEAEFGTTIMDRYSVVIQILRLHATSAEAKLQVAMAELPYIWGQLRDANVSTTRKYFLSDSQREMLKMRERKLKKELEDIRSQRKLLRNKRKQRNYPIVAVVGYTNAGKTSLIKALTNEETIQPRDQLFATLDVTAHAGVLPCRLEVLYMDTVGFMSDIPTGLIECFVATLEDAMLADVIVHVQDLSHENHVEQKRHVEETLKSLLRSFSAEKPLSVINVGNKVDLVKDLPQGVEQDVSLVSSKTLAGVHDLLVEIEAKVLEATGRFKKTFRVRSGGQEMSWLYKNAAVVEVREDLDDQERVLMDTVIADSTLQQFKHYFLRN